MNSHEFQSQVRNVGGSGKFSKHGGNNYYEPSKPTSQSNNFSQDKYQQSRQNFGGLEKNSRGKFNSTVVKNAMNAINSNPSKKVRKFAKDL